MELLYKVLVGLLLGAMVTYALIVFRAALNKED